MNELELEIPVVGVLGGTFDPVHLGHIAVARAVRERAGLERVLLMPCATPPHKEAPRLADAEHRRAMLRLAIADHPGLELCTLELDSGEVCYTIDTLHRLRHGPPPVNPVFILGMDSLYELTTWREYRRLIREFDLIAVDRPAEPEEDANEAGRPRQPAHEVAEAVVELGTGRHGRDQLRAAGVGRGGRIFHLRMPPVPISSSQIRAKVARGERLDGLVPPAVARYILSNKLYRRRNAAE